MKSLWISLLIALPATAEVMPTIKSQNFICTSVSVYQFIDTDGVVGETMTDYGSVEGVRTAITEVGSDVTTYKTNGTSRSLDGQVYQTYAATRVTKTVKVSEKISREFSEIETTSTPIFDGVPQESKTRKEKFISEFELQLDGSKVTTKVWKDGVLLPMTGDEANMVLPDGTEYSSYIITESEDLPQEDGGVFRSLLSKEFCKIEAVKPEAVNSPKTVLP